MTDIADVTIIGAGPYGLSLAAHLRATGCTFRHYGLPMNLWRTAMPKGMFLKSQGFASNLSDPHGTHTLAAYCASAGIDYRDYGLPVALDTFVGYGEWFRRHQVPDVDERIVDRVAVVGDRYEVELADGARVRSRAVVCATGVEHFAHVPHVLTALPARLCTHSSAHQDLSVFRGRSVVVVGAGQSALETAALLHESGASVRVVVRAEGLVWNGQPLLPDRPWRQRMREPEAGLGSGWSTWFYSTQPRLYRELPAQLRVNRARSALGPAGAWWLRSRAEGAFPVLLRHIITGAVEHGDGVRLNLRNPDGTRTILDADQVIAATGYRPSVRRLPFLGELGGRLRTIGGAPWVGRDFQSSLAGLYFAGPAVASSFGPVMRFVYGADYVARSLAAELAGRKRSARTLPVGALR